MADTPQEIHSVLTEARVFPPPEEFSRRAHIRSMQDYQRLWDEAARDPEKYWGDRGREELYWKEPFRTVLDWKPPHARWYVEGRTNLAYNCLDRHLPARVQHADLEAPVERAERDRRARRAGAEHRHRRLRHRRPAPPSARTRSQAHGPARAY